MERLLVVLLVVFFFFVGFRFAHAGPPEIYKAAAAFLVGAVILVGASRKTRTK
jgi:intracellular septation protein A